jgi:phage/plasmid-associated DNA primase
MDRGVLRRLIVITFNRTIPEEERVAHIGQLIVSKEADLLLAWAVDGASRLLRRSYFPELDSSCEALAEWSQSADPVLGWIEARIVTGIAVVNEPPPRLSSAEAYADFRGWAIAEGYREQFLPSKNQFAQRVTAALADRGVVRKRGGLFRGWEGLRLKPTARLHSLDEPISLPEAAE